MLLNRVKMTNQYLLELNQALSKFNNVIAGTGYNVTGKNNMVLGSYDTVKGNNNWVFVSNYEGNIDGDLVVSKWRIEMDKMALILINPKLAISYIN